MDDTPVEWKQKIEKAEKELRAMKSKLKDLKAQLRSEIKECKDVSPISCGPFDLCPISSSPFLPHHHSLLQSICQVVC